MSMFSVFNIAGSGMSAQTVRLNTVASNLANANSVSGDPNEVYRARQPVFAAAMEQANTKGSLGVEIRGIVEDQGEPAKRFEPDNPLADENGFVYSSNINPVEQMANMISASRSFQNNVEVLNTTREMLSATLRLGK